MELRRLRLPLVAPFASALGTERERDALLVRLVTDGGHEGWGECVAMSAPLYSEEYVDGAQHVIETFLLPRAFALGDGLSAESVETTFREVSGHPMAKAAVEIAVLDAELRGREESLAHYLGAVTDRIQAGVAVGLSGSLPELVDTVEGYMAAGYQRVKLKIRPSWDAEPVAALRERFGDEIALQVDANRSYTLRDVDALAALDPFGLILIEQPLAVDDLLGHAALARRIRTPVGLDESITSVRMAALAIKLGACSVVCVKAGRLGGYLEARRVHDLCLAQGVPVWCGGMLETGIGRAANLALAALPGFTLIGDLSASDRYFDRDVTAPFALEQGELRVPAGPGIGVVPDPAALAELTTSTAYFRPT